MFCLNEFAFAVQVKHKKRNSTQILGFILICLYFTTGHFHSTHVCVGLLWKNVAYFHFNSWLSFQRLCRFLWGCLIAVVLIDVDLPYWTSKVEHIVSFTAIFGNIYTAHAQKRLFLNFRCKFRHRRSICRPRFPVRVQNFGDLATFSVDFCSLYAECQPYFYFRFVWPTDLESIPHASTPTSIIPTNFEATTPIRSWVMSYNVSHWLPLKMRTLPRRMRRITWPREEGVKNNYIFGIHDPDLPIHYTTFIGLRRRLRVVYSRASPMLKPLTA